MMPLAGESLPGDLKRLPGPPRIAGIKEPAVYPYTAGIAFLVTPNLR